jgi:hypothetical protein
MIDTTGDVDRKVQTERRAMIRDAAEVRIEFAGTYVKLAKTEAQQFVIEPDIRFDLDSRIDPHGRLILWLEDERGRHGRD